MRDEYTLSLRGRSPDLPEAKLTEPMASPPTGDDYRELEVKIREVARQTRLPVARRELGRLAANYERRGNHLDRRTYRR
jgi:hypothetical protein